MNLINVSGIYRFSNWDSNTNFIIESLSIELKRNNENYESLVIPFGLLNVYRIKIKKFEIIQNIIY